MWGGAVATNSTAGVQPWGSWSGQAEEPEKTEEPPPAADLDGPDEPPPAADFDAAGADDGPPAEPAPSTPLRSRLETTTAPPAPPPEGERPAAPPMRSELAPAPCLSGASGPSLEAVTAARRRRWRGMMAGSGGIKAFIASKPETFRRRVRRGIPERHRWEVWKAASGAGDRMRPGLYQGLLRVENRWTRSIETDIARTFPDVKEFDKQQQQCLLRVLHAYANLNPEVGYCQGMNFVAGLLLMTSQKEEEAFWMLVCLMDEGKLSGFYEKKFPLLRRYLRAFDKLAAELMPDLRDHFNNEMVQPGMYLHQWFLTLFINCVPMPMVLAFWDVIVCCGLEELLPLTVALLRMLRGMLLELQFEDIVRFFKIMRAGEDGCDMAIVGCMVVSRSGEVPISADVEQLIKVNAGGPELIERWESEEDLNSPRSDDGRAGSAGADTAGTMLGYFGDIGRQLPIGAYSWWEDVKNNLQGGPAPRRASDVRMKTSI